MILGFERNGVKYLAASCNPNGFKPITRDLLKYEPNYPVKKLKKFPHSAVTVGSSTFDLYWFKDILDSLEDEKLDVNILYDKVLPEYREAIKKIKGIETDCYIDSLSAILTNHLFYVFYHNGTVDSCNEFVLDINLPKRNIVFEFLDSHKDLDYKEALLEIDKLYVKLNFPSQLPYVVYKEDDDEIELVGGTI